MAKMRRRKIAAPGILSPSPFFFSFLFFSLPTSEDQRLPSFPTSPSFPTENSLDIKTQSTFSLSPRFYALLRHKRTVVKQTIVNTIEERAPPRV